MKIDEERNEIKKINEETDKIKDAIENERTLMINEVKKKKLKINDYLGWGKRGSTEIKCIKTPLSAYIGELDAKGR